MKKEVGRIIKKIKKSEEVGRMRGEGAGILKLQQDAVEHVATAHTGTFPLVLILSGWGDLQTLETQLCLGALSVLGVLGSVRLFGWLGLCLVVLLAWNLLWRSLLASSQVSCGICRFFRTSLASTGLAKVEDVPRSHLLHLKVSYQADEQVDSSRPNF